MVRLIKDRSVFYISTAAAVFFFYYSISFITPQALLRDPDTFWHIRTGQWILDHAQLPTVDFYSYTERGKPWIAFEWLSEIFYAIAYKIGGWQGVVILSAMGCSAVIALLYFYLARHLRFSIAIGWTALTAVAVSTHFLARPHIFSYVLLLIWIVILIEAYDKDDFSLPTWITLTALMVLWANLHGSFTFGLALLYVFCGSSILYNIMRGDYARCGFLLVGLVVVSLSSYLTPYGIAPAFLTKGLMNAKTIFEFISEFRPPNFQTNPVLLFLLIALLMVIAGLGIKVRGARLIAFALIAYVGFSYARGLIVFFLLAPIILARPVAESASYFMPQRLDSVHPGEGADPVLRYLQRRFVAIPAVCLAIAVLATVSSYWRNIVPPKSIAPEEAVDFVKRTKITGNVFNSYNFGGYLIISDIPTFIDGRGPGGEELLRKYANAINLLDIDSAFQILDDYQISWIILRPSEPFSKAIARSAAWDKVYSDEYSIVFVRRLNNG